jgi:hypothetical protein
VATRFLAALMLGAMLAVAPLGTALVLIVLGLIGAVFVAYRDFRRVSAVR